MGFFSKHGHKKVQSGGASEAETRGGGVTSSRHSGITNSFYVRLIVSVQAAIAKGQAQSSQGARVRTKLRL